MVYQAENLTDGISKENKRTEEFDNIISMYEDAIARINLAKNNWRYLVENNRNLNDDVVQIAVKNDVIDVLLSAFTSISTTLSPEEQKLIRNLYLDISQKNDK